MSILSTLILFLTSAVLEANVLATITYGHFVTEPKAAEQSRILIVGDVLLARDVEMHMRRYGVMHPYGIFSSLDEYDFSVANFEAAIPTTHQPTPHLNTRFSVDSNLIASDFPFTHVSLANNHSLDFGEVGYQNTWAVLKGKNITPFGHPKAVASSSVTYLDHEGISVAVIGLNLIESNIGPSDFEYVVAEAVAQSDLQIAYVHAGVEYEARHTLAQRQLAEQLIDAGVDIYIGHHPHVVQDIDWYKDRLIFYSLGNFIFDQYFSDDVQEGLMLDLLVENDRVDIKLMPVTSNGTRTQPRVMIELENTTFLNDLAAMSHPELSGAIVAGLIQIPLQQ